MYQLNLTGEKNLPHEHKFVRLPMYVTDFEIREIKYSPVKIKNNISCRRYSHKKSCYPLMLTIFYTNGYLNRILRNVISSSEVP